MFTARYELGLQIKQSALRLYMVNHSYHYLALKETDGVVHLTKKRDEKRHRHYTD